MKKLINRYRLDFLDNLKEIKGYSDLTIKSYNEAIIEAFNYIEMYEHNGKIILNLMPYRVYIKDQNKKTISKKLSAIRSFTTFLNEQGIKNVLQADDSIKVAKTLP